MTPAASHILSQQMCIANNARVAKSVSMTRQNLGALENWEWVAGDQVKSDPEGEPLDPNNGS